MSGLWVFCGICINNEKSQIAIAEQSKHYRPVFYAHWFMTSTENNILRMCII